MLLVLKKESLCGLELEQSQTQLQILERLAEMMSAAQKRSSSNSVVFQC